MITSLLQCRIFSCLFSCLTSCTQALYLLTACLILEALSGLSINCPSAHNANSATFITYRECSWLYRYTRQYSLERNNSSALQLCSLQSTGVLFWNGFTWNLVLFICRYDWKSSHRVCRGSCSCLGTECWEYTCQHWSNEILNNILQLYHACPCLLVHGNSFMEILGCS